RISSSEYSWSWGGSWSWVWDIPASPPVPVPGRSAQTLAHRLVQHDGGSRAGVEGIELSPHGDTDFEVAGLRHQTAHAGPLAADDDGGGALQVRLIQGG